MNFPYTGLLLLLLTPFSIKAQKQSTELEDIVISSDRLQIPFKNQNRNIITLSADQIKNLPVSSLNDLLTFVAGVDVRQRGPNGAQADIGIDGGTFDQTLVLVNGFKMTDAQTGHNMMNLPIPIAAIERIEVLKGAAARAYGVNAMMGVINIITKKNQESSIDVHAFAGSSFQKDDSTSKLYYNSGIEILGTLNKNSWNHLLSGSWDQGNGYRYNTAYNNKKILYTAKGNFNKIARLELMAGISNSSFGSNAFYAAPGDKESEEEVNNNFIGLKAPIFLQPNWLLRPSFSYKNTYDDYIFNRFKPSIYRNQHYTNTIDIQIDNMIFTKQGNFQIGLNYRNEAINSSNLGIRNRKNLGLAIEYRYVFDFGMDLNTGIFINQNSAFGLKAYPGIDLGYNIHKNIRLFINAGAGQRLPTFTDLYYSSPSNIGNDSLMPEWMINYELGIKYSKKNINFHTSMFYRDGRQFIDWTRPDTLSPWHANNFAIIKTFGININGQYHYNWNNNVLNIYAAYTYLLPKNNSFSEINPDNWQSQYVINSLKHQIIGSINYSVKEWTFSLSNRYYSRYNAPNNLNQAKRSNYNLTDFRLNYKFNPILLYLNFNNLFNIQHIETGVVPLPGRWINFGIKYHL
ncbi:MAG TPA: TonB-dependent receptor [Edaphocola sp.]|nr:TonB-dependent receptor [Edaphocola sp.]